MCFSKLLIKLLNFLSSLLVSYSIWGKHPGDKYFPISEEFISVFFISIGGALFRSTLGNTLGEIWSLELCTWGNSPIEAIIRNVTKMTKKQKYFSWCYFLKCTCLNAQKLRKYHSISWYKKHQCQVSQNCTISFFPNCVIEYKKRCCVLWLCEVCVELSPCFTAPSLMELTGWTSWACANKPATTNKWSSRVQACL